jgi:uncharacterized membrane protein
LSGHGARLEKDREAADAALVVTQRAIRRLDMLEWLLLLVGAALATLGGAVLAWILAGMAGWPFRSTWIGASLLLFIVAGTVAIVKIREDARAAGAPAVGTAGEPMPETTGDNPEQRTGRTTGQKTRTDDG